MRPLISLIVALVSLTVRAPAHAVCGYRKPPAPLSPASYARLRRELKLRWPRLQRAAFQAGIALRAGSSWRSRREQARLYRRKPGLAARPGHSNHERGLAIDVQDACRRAVVRRGSRADRWLRARAAAFGFYRPMSYEAWHIELIRPRAQEGPEPIERDL